MTKKTKQQIVCQRCGNSEQGDLYESEVQGHICRDYVACAARVQAENTCDECGRPNGTEEELEDYYIDSGGKCFASVLDDGDEDPHCERIAKYRWKEVAEKMALAMRNALGHTDHHSIHHILKDALSDYEKEST